MRKNYLDNIRMMCIYILIPFHLSIAFNSWGEANYIFFTPSRIVSSINMLFTTWFMPLLFLIAGISARHSLEKRGYRKFITERIKKLLIPLMCGILTICPFMSFTADRFHNGYQGSYIEHYKIFFTKITDFTGYDGGFTPGHLWFLLYLFVASIAALGIIFLQRKFAPKFSCANLPLPAILLLFFPAQLFNMVLNFGGKSIGLCFILFLYGYYVFYEDSVMQKIKRAGIIFLGFGIAFFAANIDMFLFSKNMNGNVNFIISKLNMWFMMLGVLGVFANFFDRSNSISRYLSANSFLFYIFHFPWLLFFQLRTFEFTGEYIFSSIITMLLTYAATFATLAVIKVLFMRNKNK